MMMMMMMMMMSAPLPYFLSGVTECPGAYKIGAYKTGRLFIHMGLREI